MSKLKLACASRLVIIITFIAASIGFTGVSDTSAIEYNDATTNSISKDASPNLFSVKLKDKGKMIASWYGPGFHGRLTANGEIYDQMALTAAHKSLPFGTMLLVTNLKNGKSALVRINDRGPYIEGRDLDLSKGTALALGMIRRGVIKVSVKEVLLPFNTSPALTLN
ncbi:septal ring lytic transglycosylase RlpA family protein [Melioribacteraceae bacterium 4301-Me]|uniref:septal ring lytic transglycosylase RlpA family protein n=1 Tax=Pyranulibacter aquaticus TaxID=3163344 RepID=UPI00359BEF3F